MYSNITDIPQASVGHMSPAASIQPAPTETTLPPSQPFTLAAAGIPTDEPPPVTRRAHRRFSWQRLVLIAALVAVILTGFGVGVALAKGRKATTTHTLFTSTSTVVLPATAQDLQQTILTVVTKDSPSVVEVTSTGASGTAIGSGEFVTADGYIVTNAHVVSGYTSYMVTLASGKTATATLIGTNAPDDLAVLKIAIPNATPITFANSSQVAVGTFVLALGSPLGLAQSASFGIVSALNRTEQEDTSTTQYGATAAGPTLTGLIQTSAPINPGNSGGALVNLQGQLIGITTLAATGTAQGESVSGIGFAINANEVKTVIDQLIAA